MLVSTGAVVLHTTLYSLAEGPETQQVFGGSALALSLATPGGAVMFLAFVSYCVTPLWCSLLYLPIPGCSSNSGWRAEWQECASKP